jgi:flagellar motor protein MotB
LWRRLCLSALEAVNTEAGKAKNRRVELVERP